MENEPFYKRRSYSTDPADWQKNFNILVENYNEDFMFFLQRAASGHYKRLLTAGRTLKDLHEMLVFMQSATGLAFEIAPFPFTFSHGREYYRLLGFDDAEIDNIHGFLDYVQKTFHKDFEECMMEEMEEMEEMEARCLKV